MNLTHNMILYPLHTEIAELEPAHISKPDSTFFFSHIQESLKFFYLTLESNMPIFY
jgi:hypothetical protein